MKKDVKTGNNIVMQQKLKSTQINDLKNLTQHMKLKLNFDLQNENAIIKAQKANNNDQMFIEQQLFINKEQENTGSTAKKQQTNKASTPKLNGNSTNNAPLLAQQPAKHHHTMNSLSSTNDPNKFIQYSHMVSPSQSTITNAVQQSQNQTQTFNKTILQQSPKDQQQAIKESLTSGRASKTLVSFPQAKMPQQIVQLLKQQMTNTSKLKNQPMFNNQNDNFLDRKNKNQSQPNILQQEQLNSNMSNQIKQLISPTQSHVEMKQQISKKASADIMHLLASPTKNPYFTSTNFQTQQHMQKAQQENVKKQAHKNSSFNGLQQQKQQINLHYYPPTTANSKQQMAMTNRLLEQVTNNDVNQRKIQQNNQSKSLQQQNTILFKPVKQALNNNNFSNKNLTSHNFYATQHDDSSERQKNITSTIVQSVRNANGTPRAVQQQQGLHAISSRLYSVENSTKLNAKIESFLNYNTSCDANLNSNNSNNKKHQNLDRNFNYNSNANLSSGSPIQILQKGTVNQDLVKLLNDKMLFVQSLLNQKKNLMQVIQQKNKEINRLQDQTRASKMNNHANVIRQPMTGLNQEDKTSKQHDYSCYKWQKAPSQPDIRQFLNNQSHSTKAHSTRKSKSKNTSQIEMDSEPAIETTTMNMNMQQQQIKDQEDAQINLSLLNKMEQFKTLLKQKIDSGFAQNKIQHQL